MQPLPLLPLSFLQQVGSLIYAADRPKSYKHIIESADKDDNIRFPAVANITPKMRELLQLEPEWTFWPDYDRVCQAA